MTIIALWKRNLKEKKLCVKVDTICWTSLSTYMYVDVDLCGLQTILESWENAYYKGFKINSRIFQLSDFAKTKCFFSFKKCRVFRGPALIKYTVIYHHNSSKCMPFKRGGSLTLQIDIRNNKWKIIHIVIECCNLCAVTIFLMLKIQYPRLRQIIIPYAMLIKIAICSIQCTFYIVETSYMQVYAKQHTPTPFILCIYFEGEIRIK